MNSETYNIFVSSLIWPMVDSYYITLLFTLSMLGGRSVEASLITKKIQWLAETLYDEKVINYFESCNVESIKNAVQNFKDLGILQQKSVFLSLNEKYRNNEKLLTQLLDHINEFRAKPAI
jgi:hypothetical protein